jgi:pimeloyl-ACP methyl ester carboxylesterase
MDTATAAADVDRIRVALGEDQVSFLVFSYGTAIAEQYAQQFPTRVRAMVLDGVVDPTQDLAAELTGQTTGLQALLDDAFAACTAAGAGCPVTDPAGTFARVAARVEHDPLPSGGSVPVGPSEVSLAAVESIYTPDETQAFLAALAAADHGDGRGLAALAQRYEQGGGFPPYLAVSCVDVPHPDADGFGPLARHLATISPLVGPAVANELLPCAWWPAPVTGSTAEVHAPGAGPILVVGNTGDAATPVANAQHVAAMLATGHLVTYEGHGHTSYEQSECARAAANALLLDLTPPPDQLRCTT